MKLLLVLFGLASIATCLENGVAITPPMGWNSWNHFACNVDCEDDPENCISEYLIKSIADAMVSTGLVDYGYEYINIDDCWPAKQRDANGRLYADPKRFPSGMKSLVDYVHSKGLKFGIYEDVGYYTCGMYPGSEGNETIDAETFIEWEVDYLKLDGCWFPLDLMPAKYSEWSLKLAKSERPVVYSCSWPTYANVNNASVDYNLVGTVCNLWRAWWDITDSWDSVEFIIDWWATSGIQPYGGPGKWNDMDMLEVGNGNMSLVEYRSHFSLWSIMAAPLIMGADIRRLEPGAYEILTAKEVIAVDQDPLGIQGNRIWKDGNSEIWSKLLHDGSISVVLLNRDTKPASISVPWSILGWPEDSTALVRDLWQGKDLGTYPGAFEADVLSHGVVMIKARLMNANYIDV